MKKSLGPLPLSYPLPVFLIGSYDATGKANIMNAAWGGICASEPPCLAVSVRESRWTYACIMQRKAFTVSIPSVQLATEADFAGITSGRNTDKFARLGLTATRSAIVDAPYIEECPVAIELSLVTTLTLGSHVQFVGEVKDVKVDEACLDADGLPDVLRVNPILYETARKNYHAIGTVVARAFDCGKKFLHTQTA